MSGEHWLELLHRHFPGEECPGWDDVIVGYDFGILSRETILGWARRLEGDGPALRALQALEGAGLLDFEASLWKAFSEGTGRKLPRPGHTRWERSQDRWRLALLKDALEAPLTHEAMAAVAEAIYNQVGCPEDMLGLWRRGGNGRPVADLNAIGAFIGRQERRLAENGSGHSAAPCYTGASAGV